MQKILTIGGAMYDAFLHCQDVETSSLSLQERDALCVMIGCRVLVTTTSVPSLVI